ncbi:histidinol dehydrogenase [Iocasia frigidifontis]|uniref:Histidinol dehydrogenase n=2 Tax=Iocasia fonsfrigidae TaxID=2682810 RepID=A0A8A7KLU4_9FIRM|nr:histidinol dehydrogenase [Iocasia fonsfrigidae]
MIVMRKLSYPRDRGEINNLLAGRGFAVADERTELVNDIINDVLNNGEQAVLKYTARFDGIELDGLLVSDEEFKDAYNKVGDDFISSLKKSIVNVREFHRKQLRQNWFTYKNSAMTGQIIKPLARVGAYVPGGRAAYPSSVVMTVIPALAAGVKEVVVVSPPDKEGRINPYTLVAAREAGVDEVYKIGGAQAIAALAYGTETIKGVDKIVGPGNIYVTLAKKAVFGVVDIDMLAGPSEVLILADSSGHPDYIAADLLSQAEHDPLAISVLITDSELLAEKVDKELALQLKGLNRKEIATTSINENGLIILVDDIKAGSELVNRFAPEHFELLVKEPFAILPEIDNAGAIFIGEYSSEPLGDYLAGPNHVLPTGGTARFASPLNTDDFIKKSSIIYYQKKDLASISDDIIQLAELEGLDGHANAVKIRFEGNEFND